MPSLAATDLRPRRLVIEHLSIEIEGRKLEDVQLGGWVYGPELGTAPVVLIVGGITASPFRFGEGQAAGDESRAAWWPALCAPDLIDPSRHTVLCPSWPAMDQRGRASTIRTRRNPFRWSAWPIS